MSKRDKKNMVDGFRVRKLVLLETIKVQDAKLQNVHFHNIRFNKTRMALFGIRKEMDLNHEIIIPGNLMEGLYKCRLTYSDIIQNVNFELYSQKIIGSIKLVESNTIDYPFKYENRLKINELYDQKGGFDDILIIKNGLVTDTSYANIVFFDGIKWVTPTKPLLMGTCRNRLLQEKKIVEKDISIKELKTFQKARIINAMIDLKDSPDILMEKIS